MRSYLIDTYSDSEKPKRKTEMKITVFGASGSIGRLLVMRALDKNYSVDVYVRNPEKITISNRNLKFIKGELNETEKIQKAVSGADAVISTLRPPLVRKYDGTPVLDGHKNIIRAMQSENVTRFITLATLSVKFSEDIISAATLIPRITARLLFPYACREIKETGREVESSDLDWTIVRIIAPKDIPATGKVIVSFGEKRIGWPISRMDVAEFMLNMVEDKKYIRSMPIIGS
jgi:putative NADH-flavin reductase